MICRIYGDGVVGGKLERPIFGNGFSTSFAHQVVPVSQLFIEDTDYKTVSIFGER